MCSRWNRRTRTGRARRRKANGDDGHDCQCTGLEGAGGERDDEYFDSKQHEENGILNFIDDAPEPIERLVRDVSPCVIHVEPAQGKTCCDGFKRGGKTKGLGQGVAAQGE